jgi:Tripartite tricarboxylate transporter family receptor
VKRREFISLLGGAAAWPLAARAQQAGKLPAIGRCFGSSSGEIGSAKKIPGSEIIRREGTMIRHSWIWCGLAAALTVSGLALGQDYPNRQIIILVGIAAGGITDVTTRQYAAVLSKNMDQNIIVENRPIAGGAIAAAAVQSAAPDGYTLLSVVGSQFCSVPAMGPAPYDPVKGFAPISLTFRLPTLLVVPMDSPAKTRAVDRKRQHCSQQHTARDEWACG